MFFANDLSVLFEESEDKIIEPEELCFNSWHEKYLPKTLQENQLHTYEVSNIIQWINDNDSFARRELTIEGGHGLGKSTVVKLILTKLGLRYVTLNDLQRQLTKKKKESDTTDDEIIRLLLADADDCIILVDQIESLNNNEIKLVKHIRKCAKALVKDTKKDKTITQKTKAGGTTRVASSTRNTTAADRRKMPTIHFNVPEKKVLIQRGGNVGTPKPPVPKTTIPKTPVPKTPTPKTPNSKKNNASTEIVPVSPFSKIKKQCMIIYITNGEHSLILTALKKKEPNIHAVCHIIYFNPIRPSILTEMFRKIAMAEKIDVQPTMLLSIIENCGQNIQKIFNIFYTFKYILKCSITEQSLDEYFKIYSPGKVTIFLKAQCEKLLKRDTTVEEQFTTFDMNKAHLPLMIQDAYVQFLDSKLYNNKGYAVSKYCDKLIKVADSISNGDVIEGIIYSSQNWYLQNVQGFYACVNAPFQLISDIEPNLYSSSINKVSYVYPRDLSKNSMRKKNKQYINDANLRILSVSDTPDLLIFVYFFITSKGTP